LEGIKLATAFSRGVELNRLPVRLRPKFGKFDGEKAKKIKMVTIERQA